ncbi:hypothetical protein ACKI1I_11660 [Streptomyces turgidiscabies]|uniref:hypothetical protein n=1 Tax=Streptomyces TaxID=1883 RepID=UPI00076EFA7E|nr:MULTISPECIES: hypothetical protein [Streptomyces]MDX3494560.1 hypothetical protein [Streptomyces turgidiscabies]GAQ71166.1 hypothetical protein T45_02908 [Streptomyces turgidiscabies]
MEKKAEATWDERHPRWVVAAAIAMGLAALGVLSGYAFPPDTPESRQEQYWRAEIECHDRPYILLNSHGIIIKPSDYIGPDDPGYQDAYKTAITPHTKASFACKTGIGY